MRHVMAQKSDEVRNITKGFAVLLIFGGVYLVTSSRSRKEVEAYEAKKLQEESANK